MSRRSLLASGAALTASALIAPPGVRAQPAERMRRIGWLSSISGVRPTLTEALRELGWIEGRNFVFEVRNAEGQRERTLPLAKELVAARVELVVAMAPGPIRAAMQATSDIPIVMAWWGGPNLVEDGVIASYARPGGNVTGVDMLLSVLDAKRLDVLHQALPKATKVAVLIHGVQMFEPQMAAVREVARKAGLTLEMADTGENGARYAEAFETINRTQSQALLVMASPLFARDQDLIIERVARARVPAIYPTAANARAGGLMSYGTTALDLDRQVARQVDRILRGAKAGELPVEQPSRYEMVINLATARALELTIAKPLLLQADQIIE